MNNRHEEISRAAYDLYLKSGCVPGRDEANWLEAETQIHEADKPVKKPRAARKSPSATTSKRRKVKK